jgi:nucleoside-diphosphate-sugar epimerase
MQGKGDALMAQVLILGGTGQVGSCLARIAEERGHLVTAVHRGRNRPRDSKDIKFIAADRKDASDGLLGLRAWDIVFDLCAYNRSDVMAFLKRPVHRPTRYILASSIAVYPAGMSWREEQAPPLSAYPSYPGCYAREKREAEETAIDLSGNAAVVRLPFVLGGTASHSKFEREKERVRIQKVAYVESPDAALSVIHASDAARFLLALGESRDGAGTWNACSDGSLTVAEYLKRLAKHCWDRDLQVEPAFGPGRSGFDVHTAWETLAFLSHYSIATDWTLDNTRAKSLGYEFLTVKDTITSLHSL